MNNPTWAQRDERWTKISDDQFDFRSDGEIRSCLRVSKLVWCWTRTITHPYQHDYGVEVDGKFYPLRYDSEKLGETVGAIFGNVGTDDDYAGALTAVAGYLSHMYHRTNDPECVNELPF